MTEESKSVEVPCRIEAAAALIFEILSNPQRHMDFDERWARWCVRALEPPVGDVRRTSLEPTR